MRQHGSHSYYGVASNGRYTWLTSENDTGWNPGRTWNYDYVGIGITAALFVVRGGYVHSDASAGVFYSDITNGYSNVSYSGFRACLAP